MSAPAAVVLAGGEGTRLRPLTSHRPKPMLPVANRPILECVLDALIEAGVDRLHVVVGYRHERVQSHVGPTYRGRPITYHRQEAQLGSGHALLAARDAVTEPTVVVNGDQIAGAELIADVADAHRDADAVATVGVRDSDRRGRYGWIDVEDGRVADIVEHAASVPGYRLNAGVYAFDPEILDAIEAADPVREEQSLVRALKEFVDADRTVRAVASDGLWTDATYPWSVLTVSRDAFRHGLASHGDDDSAPTGVGVREAASVRGPTSVHATASVHETVALRPPVAIGADAEIGPGAVLGPNASIGENVTVGANAVVENAVLDADARVEANATLIDCVTGRGVRVGPGAVVPGGPGDVRVDDRVFEGESLGAVLADRAEVGGGAALEPGTLVWPTATVAAGATVGGIVDEGAEVVR